jgi:hypothetical protein
MSETAAEFRKALSEAGQPWSRRGVRTVGAGIALLLGLNVLGLLSVVVPSAAYVLIASLGLIAVGWVMLIKAVLQRRSWAKAHPVADVPLGDPTATGAP